jgi:hypothetical protein
MVERGETGGGESPAMKAAVGERRSGGARFPCMESPTSAPGCSPTKELVAKIVFNNILHKKT